MQNSNTIIHSNKTYKKKMELEREFSFHQYIKVSLLQY